MFSFFLHYDLIMIIFVKKQSTMLDFSKKIAIGSDHAGFALKEKLKEYLQSENFSISDFGTFSEESMDYPDVIHPLAFAVNSNEFPRGIIICGSGNGVAIVANKYRNIRAAVCWNEDITLLSRKHNDANIIALPARFISQDLALVLLRIFMETRFEGGRHLKRVEKIAQTL
jgi:ribose 5-phosphate isomerase B